jgi:hypothetical protein
MSKHLLRHLRQNVVAYFAVFLALGGTSYASVRLPQQPAAPRATNSAKAGITCGGACPATKVYWAYVGARGAPGYAGQGVALGAGAPNVYATAVGGNPATVLHLGLGDWLVQFSGQDLTNCGRWANLVHDRGSASIAGYDDVSQWNVYTNGIHIMTTDAQGNAADLDFNVLALCGNTKGLQVTPAAPAAGAH